LRVSHALRKHIFLVSDHARDRKIKIRNFGRFMVKDFTKKQLAPELDTGIRLGHSQQEISDPECTIMAYIENFGLCLD
jgi:hypothetical protein